MSNGEFLETALQESANLRARLMNSARRDTHEDAFAVAIAFLLEAIYIWESFGGHEVASAILYGHADRLATQSDDKDATK